MQRNEGERGRFDHVSGTPEMRVWWRALLELRSGRLAVSIVVVLAIVVALYLVLK
ncbi:hypothetical protein HF319_09340 [Xanthomonas sp. Kuri4-1]